MNDNDLERHKYDMGSMVKIDKGIQQLWSFSADIQSEVLALAMERWDMVMPPSERLGKLGLKYNASDLVRPSNEYPSTNLNKRDVITACLMGNIELYPWDAIKGLGLDSMDCGTWDGVDGKYGCYFEEKEKLGVAVINPGKPEHISDIWRGPVTIRRAKSWTDDEHGDGDFKEILKEADPEAGIIIMKPGRFYLLNIIPAVKLNGVQVNLTTRSGVARWGLNGLVNSDMFHSYHNGLLTAEAIVLSNRPLVLDTTWNPWQMYFSYNPILNENMRFNGTTKYTHTGDVNKSLLGAVREFKPEMMLPSRIKPERRIVVTPS